MDILLTEARWTMEAAPSSLLVVLEALHMQRWPSPTAEFTGPMSGVTRS